MHTNTLDTGTLDRFMERWRKQPVKEMLKKDIKTILSIPFGQYIIRCGALYMFCSKQQVQIRCVEDTCRNMARLHSLQLLEIEHGNIRLNTEGLSILNKNYNLQQNEG